MHFTGCLPAAKQKRFYDNAPPETQDRIKRVTGKISELRHRLETTEYDSTAGARLREFKRTMGRWCVSTGRPQAPYTNPPAFRSVSGSWRSQTPGTPEFGGTEDSVDRHIKAPVICFKDGQPFDVPGVAKSFPNQKVTMADLLSEDKTRNPIMQPAEDNVVRYFHLPANNMVWVEEVIARHYHEKRPEANHLFRKSRPGRPHRESKTEMILRPEYWQGQQNFDNDSEIHARHMRPVCSEISVDLVASEPNHGNMALFMPYLHWETDRGRANSAEIAKEASRRNLGSISDVVDQAKRQFAHAETQDTTASAPTWASSQPSLPGKVDRRKALGQVFLAAAALLEAMDLHTEEQLMVKYLHVQPPLHPRRTLDQAYYGALRSTRTRDRDQVVYRGTTPQPHDCIGMEVCLQCNEDIRKTPRIIMVDQLWLWILDESKHGIVTLPTYCH